MASTEPTVVPNEEQNAIPFVLVNAFTDSRYGGNPAAVLLLPAPLQDKETYQAIARNFNQPTCVFLSPAERPATSAKGDDAGLPYRTWHIRWFTVTREQDLCGHGMLVAAHALFNNLFHSDAQVIPENVTILKFETMHGRFEARRLTPEQTSSEEGSSNTGEVRVDQRYEIIMPIFEPVLANPEEFERAQAAVNKALGKQDVKVNFVGVAGEDVGSGSDGYILIEVEVEEKIGEADVDASAFLATRPRRTNVLTSRSKVPGVAYVVRMFAPAGGVPEDHVCGSANCINAPYWARKHGLGPDNQGAKNREMAVLQVSKRGGRIWTEVDWEKGKVLLRGEATLTAKGEIYM